MSVAPPAAKGTMMRTGRAGYACAQAKRDTVGSAAAPAARCRKYLRWGSFISDLPGIRATVGFPQSLRLDVGHPDHLAPFPGLVGDEFSDSPQSGMCACHAGLPFWDQKSIRAPRPSY